MAAFIDRVGKLATPNVSHFLHIAFLCWPSLDEFLQITLCHDTKHKLPSSIRDDCEVLLLAIAEISYAFKEAFKLPQLGFHRYDSIDAAPVSLEAHHGFADWIGWS